LVKELKTRKLHYQLTTEGIEFIFICSTLRYTFKSYIKLFWQFWTNQG